jgi:hypothetical protein
MPGTHTGTHSRHTARSVKNDVVPQFHDSTFQRQGDRSPGINLRELPQAKVHFPLGQRLHRETGYFFVCISGSLEFGLVFLMVSGK